MVARQNSFLLRDAVEELKSQLIGQAMWDEHECLPMYSKFFDNQGALPFHIHHNDEFAARVNAKGKPEAYYFPPQVNNHGGDFPYTFMGLSPGVTKDQVRETLVNFTRGDNRITDLSAAYCLTPGTGWDIPPGRASCTWQHVHLRTSARLRRVRHVRISRTQQSDS